MNIKKITQSGLNIQFFLRQDSGTGLKMSASEQKKAILQIMHWLNDYQNIKQLSPIGKNPLVRYNWVKDSFKTIATIQSVRLDCQGKKPECRYYLQQDDVKGKTNLVQFYIQSELNKLMQLNDSENQKLISQKWRGRVQRAFKYFRNYIKESITQQAEQTPCIKITLNQ